LVASAAGAQKDPEAAERNRFVDKYARTFSLDGAPRELCRDEMADFVANEQSEGKSREQSAATADRMLAKLDRIIDQERAGHRELSAAGSSKTRGPVARLYLCYLKARLLKDMPIGGERVSMTYTGSSKPTPLAMAGEFQRTGANTWQFISNDDLIKGGSEYDVERQQRKNRAKTKMDFPLQEAQAACDAELKAADREEIAKREADLARLQAQLREAEQKGDNRRKNGYATMIESRTAALEDLRAKGPRSSQSPVQVHRIAEAGEFTAAEIRKTQLPSWEASRASPAGTTPAYAAAQVCLLKLRLAQLEGKK
jgi:hypothetical protein